MKIENLIDYRIDEAEEIELFEKLTKVDGLEEYLEKKMRSIIVKFFSAPEETHKNLRGAYSNIEFMLTMLRYVKDKQKLDKNK